MIVLEKEIFAVSMVKFFKEGHTYEEECASGFFYKQSDNLYFITNRHVVCDANHSPEQLRLRLHVDKYDLTKNRTFSLPLYNNDEPKWFEHPIFGEDVDIVALPIDKEDISKFYIESFNKHDLNTSRYLDLGEELLVAGYPEGEHDNLHNTPIARAATIATPYIQPFRGRQGFLIDSRLHNGTSGSPVLTKPTTFIRNFNGRAELVHHHIKSFKKYLIGVHSEKFDERYPELDLSFVWFASLIPKIIERQ